MNSPVLERLTNKGLLSVWSPHEAGRRVFAVVLARMAGVRAEGALPSVRVRLVARGVLVLTDPRNHECATPAGVRPARRTFIPAVPTYPPLSTQPCLQVTGEEAIAC
eukprot:7862448-Pyramimonas_sp.AAC.1